VGLIYFRYFTRVVWPLQLKLKRLRSTTVSSRVDALALSPLPLPCPGAHSASPLSSARPVRPYNMCRVYRDLTATLPVCDWALTHTHFE
jgi:hypothetical protein